MQYWIFYQAGVGGDGFGCMLEHASNIFPADGILEWRVEPYKDDIKDKPIRFHGPDWAHEPKPFRYAILHDNAVLNPVYTKLIQEEKNTIITSHHSYFNQIDQFKYRDIVEKDQVKIHLYSDRPERVRRHLSDKRGAELVESDPEEYAKKYQYALDYEFTRPEYAIHINIEKVWRDWGYTKQCMDQLGIDLSKDTYDQYLTYIKPL